jgi:hypothetical protein
VDPPTNLSDFRTGPFTCPREPKKECMVFLPPTIIESQIPATTAAG